MIKSLLLRATALLRGPENYSRHAQGAVIHPEMQCFTLTGLLERASCRSTNSGLMRGDPAILAEAKAELCSVLHTVHLDDFEARNRPSWEDVKQVFKDWLDIEQWQERLEEENWYD